MKKLMILLVIFVFLVPALLMGCGKKEKEEVPKEAVVETVEKAEGAAGEELDPWLEGIRAEVKEYYGSIDSKQTGVNGSEVTWDKDSLKLTVAEVEKVRKGNYKVGLPWMTLIGEYFESWRMGVHDACKYLNMEIVAETDADWDPAKQKSDIESILTQKPDLIIGMPVEVYAGAEAFRPVVEAGIPISFVSDVPVGYVKGKDYIGCSSCNFYDLGIYACKLAGEKIGKGGKFGIISWAQDSWINNYVDQVVIDNVEKYGLEIVDQKGFITPDEAYTAATSTILSHPEVQGFYITDMISAMQVASACEAAKRPDIKIIACGFDLPSLINLVQGKNIQGLANDATYLIGVNSVIVGAYGLLGKEGPEYAVCPAIPIKVENLREYWKIVLRDTPLPDVLDQALKQEGF